MCRTGSLFKETCQFFVRRFIVCMQMFPPLFCWNLAPHPLPSACYRDSGEWIHSKGSQQSLLLNWTLCELGPTPGSMHQKKYIISPGCSGFDKDYHYQHHQHPRVSVCPTDTCLSDSSVSSKAENEVRVWRHLLLFCHYIRQMNTHWCGQIAISSAI